MTLLFEYPKGVSAMHENMQQNYRMECIMYGQCRERNKKILGNISGISLHIEIQMNSLLIEKVCQNAKIQNFQKGSKTHTFATDEKRLVEDNF